MTTVRITVTGVMADRHPADLHLFTNYQLAADILGCRQDLPTNLSPAKVQTLYRTVDNYLSNTWQIRYFQR